ncbi:MAG: LUD domain-containing protein [Deltaproteobacteria bacterium]|nr:LUD domain-containing protein [Deltaproteobacteria bacterium]
MRDSFEARAVAGVPEGARLARHDAAVFALRGQRDAAVAAVRDWEALRERAAAIKAHALDHLDLLLERFEEKARGAGAFLHWAQDGEAMNAIVAELLAARGAKRVVKSKSMLTEEAGLNRYLHARGAEVVDTDLGERIVQLGEERPSHIIVPAIHRSRGEVGALFQRTLGTPPGMDDPEQLARAARRDLRARFLAADAGITGANFAIAETGSIVVVTNEGNADLGMSLPELHIACFGIEKVIPALADLGVFLRLLARSATGQPLSAYTSMVTGPRAGGELHLVLVDNGRSELLADPVQRGALACIRCGACLNTCPVFRRAGGHAYGPGAPGPIGAVLAPALGGRNARNGRGPRGGRNARSGSNRAQNFAASLPLASSLCGSCSAVCPVRIDLHGQLLAWRSARRSGGAVERVMLRAAAGLMLRPRLLAFAGRVLRRLWRPLGWRIPGNPAAPWLQSRELPPHPGASFRESWQRETR